jgi:alpha-ketoglutarate-dependent taurine dioxygenase
MERLFSYINENKNTFTYKVFQNILATAESILAEINKTENISIIKNSDWVISHVIQSSDIIADNTAIDNSKNTTNFNIHTDWPYYQKVPEVVGLYCLNPWLKEASTYIIDTQKALQHMLDDEINILRELEYTYIGKDSLLYPRDLIELDPLTSNEITNLSTRWFVSPKIIAGKELIDMFTYNKVLQKFYDALEKSVIYEHFWETWDLFLFNNNRYLHWRKSTKKDLDRHLLRFRLSIK